jgi:glycine cleavage system H protein
MVYYTHDHEWIEIEGGTGTIGITAYAAEHLGDITYVEMPKLSLEVKKGEILCAIESVKAASDIFAPMSGRIITVNDSLESNPAIVNQSPERDGWIAKIELSDPGEAAGLLSRQSYEDFIKGL